MGNGQYAIGNLPNSRHSIILPFCLFHFLSFVLKTMPHGFGAIKKGCSNLQPSQCGFQIFFIVLFYDQLIGEYCFFTIT